ncbi:Multidrug efflux pump subunit AcrB [Candidatus Electrothrix aarhusensis]|uniref:Multidrug efflux pump subunit AcrB n=1 Tax=Candidatus Electrothrix aarhusensis TaxID=1859131 RepID=A0A3S3QH95_9BACT|nr:Multidrug efflux pump subunit AcrB [Candidatus Electrothrix aarhusensis]
MKKLLTAFASNTVFANIVLLMIMVGGVMALSSMRRENFPEFSVDKIMIQVVYPGADPEEVEEGVVLKIEEALEGIEGIKQYTTTAAENMGSALVDIQEGGDVDEILDDVKSKIDAISTLPIDAEKPVITELTMRNSVVLLALSGKMSEKQLKVQAERLTDEIRSLDGISQVDTFGTRDYEISIEVSEEQLRRYGLTFTQVAEAVRRSSINLHGGTLRTEEEEIRLRTVGRKYTGEELAQIIVRADTSGEQLRLGQLATIRDGFAEDPIISEVNGEPAAFVMVFKTEEEDAIHIADTVQQYIVDKQPQLPPGVHLEKFYDNTRPLRARINLLTRNGIVGLILVFCLLWLFLDLRLAFWSGMGIPISLSGAMFILWYMGETMNMISLFGVIMVLGIVVDDAIVVGEAIYVHRRKGLSPLRAAVEGVTEVAMPVFAAVTTTVVAFIPLAFVGGVMGKFIEILPTVVIASLLVSLWECLFLLPAHLSHLPDLNRPVQKWNPLHQLQRAVQAALDLFINRVYLPFLAWALQWRYIFLAISISSLLLAVGLVQGGLVKFQVFPKTDSFVVTANVSFPEGTPLDVTLQALKKMEQAFLQVAGRTQTVSGDPLIEQRMILVGQSLSSSQRGQKGPHLGSVQFIILPDEKRGVHSNELMIDWEEEIGSIAGAKSLTFEGESHGPGGAELEFWIQGDRMPDILAAAEQLQDKLRSYSGVIQIRSDNSPGENEFRLTLKPEAGVGGLTVEDLALQVNAGFYGREAFRVQRGQDDIRVKVRYTLEERSRITDFQQMRIRTSAGHEVPLISVADMEFGPGFSTITRTDGLRRVAVTADVDPKRANAQDVFADLASFFQQLEEQYPGLQVSTQGEKKNMRESFAPLKVTVPLAVLGIFVIVATIFRSYIQPLVILVSIPFGIIGAILAHLLLGYDLSMMSMFGMVALTGVVVNDAIVLIERINENLAEGMSFHNAVIKGGARRFRAILLTSVSTVGGLAPLIVETDMQAQFLIPMALSLAGGVVGSTVLTLVLIPSLLAIVNDGRRMIGRLQTGVWLEREAVEPAATRRVDRME